MDVQPITPESSRRGTCIMAPPPTPPPTSLVARNRARESDFIILSHGPDRQNVARHGPFRVKSEDRSPTPVIRVKSELPEDRTSTTTPSTPKKRRDIPIIPPTPSSVTRLRLSTPGRTPFRRTPSLAPLRGTSHTPSRRTPSITPSRRSPSLTPSRRRTSTTPMSRNRVPSTPRRSTASSRETRSPTGPLASSSHGRRLFPINEDEVMTIDDSPTPPSSPTLSTRAGSRALTAQRELFDRPFSAFSDGHITYRGSEIPWQRPREVSPFQRVQRARKEIGEGSGSGSGSGLQQVVGSPLPGNVYEACGRLLQVIKNALTPTLTEDEKTRIVSTPDEKLKVATTFRFVVDTLLGSEMNDTRTKIIDRVMDDQDPEGDPNITKENVSVLLGILSTSLRYLFSGSQNDFISPSSQNRTKSRSVRQAEWWASFRASLVFPAQDLRDEMNEAQVDRVLGSLRVIWIRDETSILESIKPHMTGRDSLRDTVEMVGELCKAIKNLLFSIG